MGENTVVTAQEDQAYSEDIVYTQEMIDGMSTEDLLRLYKKTGRDDLKWPVVLRYVGLIKNIVCQLTGIYSSFAQLDDIVSEGIITLAGAVERYDPDKGTKFETFVSRRVRGMVIDMARKQDWVPRNVRKRSKEVYQTTSELHNTLGRFPTDAEVAAKLGITPSQYLGEQSRLAFSNLMSLEEVLEGREQGRTVSSPFSEDACAELQPELALEEQELHEVLAQGIKTLRRSEQIVLSLYYQKNLSKRDIAQVMGVSAPRISQIYAKAIQKLRIYLEQYTKNS